MVYSYEIENFFEEVSYEKGCCYALSRGLEKLQILIHDSLFALVTQKKAANEYKFYIFLKI